MEDNKYVHGYSETENARLHNQASTLTELFHHDTVYPAGQCVLEAGCGIGSQTITLAKKSPHTQFISVDISEASLNKAKQIIKRNHIKNVKFQVANLYNLPYEVKSFDHVFVCFVLEHVTKPIEALHCLKKVLKPGGSITLIEGDHGSAFYHPQSKEAQKTIDCLIELQHQMGGNSLIGRELYPLLSEAGFRNIVVSPRFVYADNSLPNMVEGFTKNTFAAMVEGVEKHALEAKLIDKKTWDKGIKDLYRTAEEDGTFCYTFFKAIAYKG